MQDSTPALGYPALLAAGAVARQRKASKAQTRRIAVLAVCLVGLYASLLGFANLRTELGRVDSHQELRSAIAPTTTERLAQAEQLFELARQAHRARRLTYAERLYRRALASFEVAGNLREQVLVLNGLGVVRRQRGDLAEARSLHRKSLRLAEALEEPALRALAYNNLGIVAQLNGEGQAAQKFYQETLSINQARGDLAAVSAALNNLGILAKERGAFALAESHHRDSLEASTQAGDKWGLVGAHNRLGDLERRKGKVAEARTHYEESLRLATEIGSVYDEGLNYLGLAYLEIAQGKQWEACDLLKRASRKLDRAGAPERHRATRMRKRISCNE